MKYAILADVHANIEALRAVVARVSEEGVDRIVCLGDIVGYNASPNECVALVREREVRSIAGNHDRAAVGAKDMTRFGMLAKRAIEWTEAELEPENREYLAALPSTALVDGRFFVVHGALHPEPNDELHLSNDARVVRSFSELVTGRFGTNICFFGHSHRSVIYEHRAGRMRRGGTTGGTMATLAPDAYYLVNPGSVGQSRDGDWRAAYALFDGETGRLELRRVAYDIAATERRARHHGLTEREGFRARSARWLEGHVDRARDALVHGARSLLSR